MIKVSAVHALSKRDLSLTTWERALTRLQPEARPIIRAGFTVEPHSKVFTVGSCFARNIEEHIAMLGFEVPTLAFTAPTIEWRARPNGILNKYTPPAVAQELEWASKIARRDGRVTPHDCEAFRLDDGSGKVIDTNLGGLVPVTPDRFMERRQQVFDTFAHAFSSQLVVITLGLVEAWFDLEHGIYIQQAPSTKALLRLRDRFELHVLDHSTCLNFAIRSIRAVQELNAAARFLVTTSPVPLQSTFSDDDVIVANMYSKSVLRATAGDLAQQIEAVDYFPSYETVSLSKAERVWQADRRHVTDAAVGQIVAQLISHYFPEVSGNALAFQRAQTLSAARDWSGAEREIGLALDSASSAGPWLLAGRIALGRKRFEEALERIERALAIEPKHSEGLALKIEVLWRAKKLEAALDAALELKDAVPQQPVGHYWVGRILLAQDSAAQAEDALAEAARLAPRRWAYHHHLAEAHAATGNLDEALRSQRRAVNIRSDAIDARRRLAELLMEQGKTDEAERVLEKREGLQGNQRQWDRYDQLLQRVRASSRGGA